MISYFLDKEEKHLDDLLFHLRKHNTKHTGEKTKTTNYIYAIEKNHLKGAMKTVTSWDWISISHVHYDNLEVLSSLLLKVHDIYKERSGIHIYTKEEQVCKDFETLGFERRKPVTISPKRKTTYLAELCTAYQSKPSQYFTISSHSEVHEFSDIMKQKQKEYMKRNDVKEASEYILYTAKEEDEYVGGIYLELYEDSLYIDLLAVNEKYRERNVGTTLMNLALEEALKRDFVSIDVGTAEFQAKGFYEKLGYKVIATKQNQPKGFECYTLLKTLKEEII